MPANDRKEIWFHDYLYMPTLEIITKNGLSTHTLECYTGNTHLT